MASIMIHLAVAKKVNKDLKMPENLLFLGTLAPNLSSELNKSKAKSHFYNRKKEIDLDKFINKYQYKMWYPYVIGYFIHLYTDKLWNERFMPNYIKQNKIKLKGGSMSISSIDIINKLIYEDYTNLATTLIDKYDINLGIFFNELTYPKIEVDEIPTKKLDLLINRISSILTNIDNKNTLIFDWKEIYVFINETSKEIISFLEQNNF